MKRQKAACFALAIELAGCTSFRPGDVSGPRVKIEDAFEGVGKGMRHLQTVLNDPNGEGQPIFLGVRTCKIAIQFQVAVQAADKGTAGVTLGYAPYVQANAGQENTSGANAGNLVTVELDGTDTNICKAAAKPSTDQKPDAMPKSAPQKSSSPNSQPASGGTASADERINKAVANIIKTPVLAQNLDKDAKTGKICFHRKPTAMASNPIPPCSGDM